jgi:uncharacterized membrane protein
MEELFIEMIEMVALLVEGGAAVVIAMATLEAFYHLARRLISPSSGRVLHKKEIWVRFAVWLVLALEFELAADILRSAISPSWDDVGQLAAIAASRTFLNYFLEKDIEKYGEEAGERRARPAVAVES